MSEAQKIRNSQGEYRAKAGLEILFAKRPSDGLDGLRKYDVVKEVRERFWISEAENAGETQGLWSVGAVWRMERHDLGKDRSEPGDGFRYAYRMGADGGQSRAEWFEVTEVFAGVEAKDIEAFMLLNHEETVGWNFDPDRFLRGLDMGIHCPDGQRRAAACVLSAVEKKLNKASYRGMWREHGYGTLVVGLPLWFAIGAADPSRVEDFGTRVRVGLESFAPQLERKSCPFRRIAVVWMASAESLRQLSGRIRSNANADPAFRNVGKLPEPGESLLTIASALEKGGRCPLMVHVSNPKKRGEETSLRLPPRVDAAKRALETRQLADPAVPPARVG